MYGFNGTGWVGHAVGLPGADSVRGGGGVACMGCSNKLCLDLFVCKRQPQVFAAAPQFFAASAPNWHLQN